MKTRHNKTFFSHRRIALFLAAALMGIAQLAKAVTYTWNASSGNWSTPANWNPGTSIAGPASGDTAVFGTTGTSANSTTINNTVDVNFGITSLMYTNITSGQWHVTQIPSGTTLTVSGSVVVGGYSLDGATTSAAMNGGGTFVANGTPMNIQDNGTAATGAAATFDLSGLTNFVFNNSGGTITIASSGSQTRGGGNLILAAVSNSITGGTLNFQTGTGPNGGTTSTLLFGSGTNILNIGNFNIIAGKSSGTIQFNTVNGGLRIRGTGGTDADRANFTIGNRNTTGTGTSTGTLSLNGHAVDIRAGTITMGQAASSGGNAAVGSISFDQGVLDATTINMGIAGNAAVLGATGNLSVGTSGNLIANAISLVNQTAGAGGAGNLIVTNGGTATVVNNLVKTTTAGTATISVTNSTLAVGGVIGTPAAPINTLNLASASLHLKLNGAAIVTNVSATTINASGTTTITIDNVSGLSGTATFPLIHYTGTDPYSSLSLGSLPSGSTSGSLIDNTAAQTIDLTVTTVGPPALTWTAAANNNWNTSTINWKDGSSNPTNYTDGDALTFDDTASSGLVTLNGTLSPNNTIVTNNSLAYTFSGSGKLSGGTGLSKQGSATLVIDNTTANDFSGGVVISGGTVQIGNNDANGSLPGNITDNGALAFKRTDDFTIANVISGSGSVANIGTGTNRLTGANNYTGTTLISSGEVVANNASLGNSSLGNFAGAVYITNGATLDIENTTASAISFTNTTDNGGKQFYIAGTGVGGNGVIVNNGTANQQNAFQRITLTANATVGGPTRWDMRVADGKFWPILDFGGFTLTKTGTNQMSMVGLQLINGGNLVINNGIFSLETSSTNSGTAITVNASGKLGHFRQWAGILTAPITLNGGAITNLTGNNGGCTNDSPITLTADSSLGGGTGTNCVLFINNVISQSGGSRGITVVNGAVGTSATGLRLAGVQLSGTNTYTGNTYVQNGYFYLAGNGSIANSANIIIAGGAMLDVSALASTFTLSSGQTLSNSTSTVQVDGNWNTASGKLGLTYASGTPSFTETNGTLTLSSGTALYVNNTGAALTAGSYKVVSASTGGTVAGTAPSSVTVGGGGLAAGLAASAQITGNELYVVVASSSPPRLARINISGTTLTIVATNGTSGAQWTLLQSTNLAIPFSQWQTNTVLTFTTDGGITNTANVATNAQTYYILKQ